MDTVTLSLEMIITALLVCLALMLSHATLSGREAFYLDIVVLIIPVTYAIYRFWKGS